MNGPDVQDWVFWASGGVVALGGAVLALWALFWDRAQGRKRCPKCWYDMSAAVGVVKDGREVFVCPECGRTTRRARALMRTRRKWRLTLLGVVVLAGGALSAAWPTVARRGWPGMLPSWALLAVVVPDDVLTCAKGFLAPGPAAEVPLAAEFVQRWRGGRLPRWQRVIALRRLFTTHPEIASACVALPRIWPAGESMEIRVYSSVGYLDRRVRVRARVGLPGAVWLQPAYLSGQDFTVVPEAGLRLDAVPIEVEFFDAEGVIYRTELTRRLKVGGTVDTFLDRDPVAPDWIRSALDPRLLISENGAVYVAVNDVAYRALAEGVRCQIAFRAEVLLDGVPVGTGGLLGRTDLRAEESWTRVPTGWNEGAFGAIIAGEGEVSIRIVGNPEGAGRAYMRDWFEGTRARKCWAGEFTVAARKEPFVASRAIAAESVSEPGGPGTPESPGATVRGTGGVRRR